MTTDRAGQHGAPGAEGGALAEAPAPRRQPASPGEGRKPSGKEGLGPMRND